MFHGLPYFASKLPPRGRYDTISNKLGQRYGLWMGIKSSRYNMVTTLGLCVKRPLANAKSIHANGLKNKIDVTKHSQRCLSMQSAWSTLVFKIEVFNALQMQFGPSKYTSLKKTLQNATPNCE